MDDSGSLMEVKKAPGTLTTALAAITTQVDYLSQGKASQVATISAQLETRAENPTATSSASFDLNMEEQVWMRVKHRARSAHTPFLAITDDETDGEEEERIPAPRKGTTTSGKLRSADTSAIHQVMWPHKYVFTPEGQPTAYESQSTMAFVTGYLPIMDLQSEPLRR